jgi:septation ring formation regulator EzrA
MTSTISEIRLNIIEIIDNLRDDIEIYLPSRLENLVNKIKNFISKIGNTFALDGCLKELELTKEYIDYMEKLMENYQGDNKNEHLENINEMITSYNKTLCTAQSLKSNCFLYSKKYIIGLRKPYHKIEST